MKTLYESIFDVDDNIKDIDHSVSSMNRLGVKSIIVKIYDGKDITNDKNIKQVFRNADSRIFNNDIDINIFHKKVNILDQHWNTLYINSESTRVIYNIAERCCEELLYAQENHKGMVDAYMTNWIKKAFNGVNHKFQYWRKSKAFSIVFCPQKGDIIVRIICSARTK